MREIGCCQLGGFAKFPRWKNHLNQTLTNTIFTWKCFFGFFWSSIANVYQALHSKSDLFSIPVQAVEKGHKLLFATGRFNLKKMYVYKSAFFLNSGPLAESQLKHPRTSQTSLQVVWLTSSVLKSIPN